MQITWEKTAEERYRAGYRKMMRKTFTLPNGTSADFDVEDGGSYVCVFPLTSAGTVVLAKQYRPGPERVLLELPGGGVEAGEEPIEAAARELLEETGYAGTLHFLGVSVVSAYSNARRFHFIATDCRLVQAPVPDATEFIEPVELGMEDFKVHLQTGELSDLATGLLGLAHLRSL